MTVKRLLKSRAQSIPFFSVCVLTFFVYTTYVFAAEQTGTSALARYRVFSFRHITAEQAKQYLAQIKIGTASKLPRSNVLLVTALAPDLVKASAILRLVDSDKPFVIKAIYPASEVDDLPSLDKIEADIGNMSIGTFAEPPHNRAEAKAIIDVHNDIVVAIAEPDRIEQIIATIEQLREQHTQVQLSPPAKPQTTTEANLPAKLQTQQIAETKPEPEALSTAEQDYPSDDLFDKLLNSLAESERTVLQSHALPAEPNIAQPSENADLAAIMKKLEALEAQLKQQDKLQPTPEVAPTQQPEEIIKPTQVARHSYRPAPIPDGNEVLSITLPEKLNIVDLLALVGEYLHLDYMYDPAKIKGEVTLRLQGKLDGPLKLNELYPLVESVLKFKGFVMSRKGNLVVIVPIAEAHTIDPILIGPEDGVPEFGDVIITRIFKLKHVGVANAKNLLVSMKLGLDINTSVAELGKIIVTGYAYRMPRIERLLDMIDVPGEPKQFRYRQLRYTMAQTLAPKIKTLVEQLGQIQVTVAAPTPAKPASKRAAKGRRSTSKPAEALTPTRPTVYLDADERTNRILMIGLEDQLAIVNDLIDTLDVAQQDLRTMRLYDIQFVGAEEVQEKLTQLGVISTTGAKPAPTKKRSAKKGAEQITTSITGELLAEEPQVVVLETTNSLLVNATAEQHARIAMIISYVDAEPEEAAIPYVIYPLENQDPERLASILLDLIQETVVEQRGKEDKITTTIKKIEDVISIVPDPNTYSLIVYASKKNQLWISSLIRQLDEYRPQVLLDVTLVEIKKDEAFTLDLDLLTKYPTIGKAGTLGKISNIVDDPGRRLWEFRTNPSGGKDFIRGFYADGHIQALLKIIETKSYGRILARPKLLVNDNQTGRIRTEDTEFVALTQTNVIPTSTGQSTTQTTVDFKEYTAGIELIIQPHISKGNQLRLNISLDRTDFTGEQETISVGDDVFQLPRDTTQSYVETVVTVPDGATIILGGLEKVNQTKSGSKIPLLGDIPFIGGLFRSVGNTDSQSRLYIFVKANILRPGEELTDVKMISNKNRNTFEKYEKEMQEHEDWPGVKPKPMDPLKVLSAD